MIGSDILIYRLVYNLVENAIKYNHAGGLGYSNRISERKAYLSVGRGYGKRNPGRAKGEGV